MVQLSRGDGDAEIVQIARGQTRAPNLERLLADPRCQALPLRPFRPRRALPRLSASWPARSIAPRSPRKLARTYTDRHGLKDLTRELLGVEISKQQQSSDWGAETLTDAQLAYAASDVLHLHALREKLDAMLVREGRDALARAAFAYLPERVRLDLAGSAKWTSFRTPIRECRRPT